MPCSEPGHDLPPIELPARKRLKRSQSTTSITSLPTPPRTRKRKRSRSRHSRATDSDSESDNGISAYDSDEEEIQERQRKDEGKDEGSVVLGHKKRKILRVDAIAAELSGKAAEDAFWGVVTADDGKAAGPSKVLSKEDESARSRSRSRSPTRSPSCSPPPHLLKRNATGLLSPPQSRRHKSPRILPFPIPVKAGEPVTPPRRTRVSKTNVRRRLFPERDSPNNPFLDDTKGIKTPGAVRESSSPEAEPTEPRTPVPYVEKPTITYVFRGVRTEFENPLYDPKYPKTGVPPPDADAPSKLPPEHPDFEPEPYCPPKLLFPEAHARARRKQEKSNGGSGSASDNDGNVPNRKTHERVTVEVKGKGKGKEKVVAIPDDDRTLSRRGEITEENSGTKSDGARSPPVVKTDGPSGWESSDDEADREDDRDISPIARIALPRGLVAKEAKPATSQVRADIATKCPVPSRPPEKDKSEPARRIVEPGSKEATVTTVA